MRVVVSAVVGAALLFAWVRAYRTGVFDRVVEGTGMGEFLLLVVVGLPVALVLSALLAGPLLWLLRVRPVWPVVLCGPVLLGVAYYSGVPERFSGVGDRWTVLVLLAGASYGVAGLITSPSALRRD